MPAGKTRYCWDSCVFISLLTGTGRTPEELASLRDLERLSDNGDITIFTPSITLIEVLECYLTPEQEVLFQEILKRSRVYMTSVSHRVAQKAREIRNHYRAQGLEIAVPDAIHIATAIHYDATALHTYDGCGKRPRKTDLLRLATPLIGKYDLTICKPEPPPKPESLQSGATESPERTLFDGIGTDGEEQEDALES
jgi:predicted nucleic acid-binding protein